MAVVGYFLGTDSKTLSRLVVNGVQTLPVSNGYDHHGKLVAHLTHSDGIRAVIGPLYKTVPVGEGLSPNDILYNLKVHQIPVLLVSDPVDEKRARELLGEEMRDYVRLTTEDKLFDEVTALIGEG